MSSGSKAVASAPLTAAATPASPTPVPVTPAAVATAAAAAPQTVVGVTASSASAVVPATAPASPSVSARGPQTASPLSGASNTAASTSPSPSMPPSSDTAAVRKADNAGSEGNTGTGAGVAAASRTRSTVTASTATPAPSLTPPAPAAPAQATGEIYSQQPGGSASSAGPIMKTQSIDHTPAVKQQAQQVNSPDIIAASGEKFSFAPAPFLLDGPGLSYPDMTLASVMKGTEVLSPSARERLMSGQGVEMLPGIEKVAPTLSAPSALLSSSVSIDTMASRTVPFSSATASSPSASASAPSVSVSAAQVAGTLLSRADTEPAVTNSLSLSSSVQSTSVDNVSSSALSASYKTSTPTPTYSASSTTSASSSSVSPWKSLQDVAPAMVVTVTSPSTPTGATVSAAATAGSPSASPPAAYSPTLMTSLDNIRMPVTPPREREKAEESSDMKGRSVDNSAVVGASLRNTVTAQAQGQGQGQSAQADQRKKRSAQTDMPPSSDFQTPWFRASPGPGPSSPSMSPPLPVRQQMSSTDVTAMLPSSSSSSSSSAKERQERQSESDRVAEDSRVKGASLYPKRKHSIDDVDDADNNWLEIDTTFGEW